MQDNFIKLFNDLNRVSLGYSNVFKDLDTFPQTTYPPYNIVNNLNDTITIELAVAGFTKDDISIVEENGWLTINVDRGAKDDLEYFYKGISTRKASTKFRIAECFEFKDVKLENGILAITYANTKPQKKQKTITIN